MLATAAVFAFGSLLDPSSLLRTLPAVDLESCWAARLMGHVRTFGVAFPNDASQDDKAYFDGSDRRPPFVLFCDVVRAPRGMVNGIVIPVGDEQLQELRRRELRYEVAEVSGRVVDPSAERKPPEPCVTFVGRPEFTVARDVERGVVPRAYLDSVLRGVDYWERRLPGFATEFRRSTELPSWARVVDLRRVDLA